MQYKLDFNKLDRYLIASGSIFLCEILFRKTQSILITRITSELRRRDKHKSNTPSKSRVIHESNQSYFMHMGDINVVVDKTRKCKV